MEANREEKRKVKRCIIHSKKKVNEQFRRKRNVDVNRNRKLFRKEVSNAKEEKVEGCSRIKGGNSWQRERTKCEGSRWSILKICII